MSIARFQIALNSENPIVVKQGLREFSQTVLLDHDAKVTFGHHGIPMLESYANFKEALYPLFPSIIIGALKQYLSSSPNLQELFTIWDLPGREFDFELCMEHTRCLAVIIHCSQSNHNLVQQLANRVVYSYGSSILNQLQSSDMELFYSTIGLLIACIRVVKVIPEEVVPYLEKLIFSGGKSFEGSDNKAEDFNYFSMLTYLVFQMISELDLSLTQSIITNTNFMKRMLTNASSKSNIGLSITLSGLMHIIINNFCVQENADVFLSKAILNNIAELSLSDEYIRKTLAKQFLGSLAYFLINIRQESKRGGLSGRLQSKVASNLVDCLRPQFDEEHLKIQQLLLDANPHLLFKCISSLRLTSWEPNTSREFLDSLDQLIGLLSAISKPVIEELQLQNKQSTKEFRVAISNFISRLLPKGLTKKEITKIIGHSLPDISIRGYKLISKVLCAFKMLDFTIISSGDGLTIAEDTFEENVVELNILFLNKTKVFENLSAQIDFLTAATVTKQASIEDSLDLELNLVGIESETVFKDSIENFDAKENAKLQIEKGNLLANEYFSSLFAFMKVFPCALLRKKLDMIRLVEELMRIMAGKLSHFESEPFCSLIDLLEISTSQSCCAWFGYKDEAFKLLNQIIVSEDWMSALKKSAFSNLLIAGVELKDLVVKHKLNRLINSVFTYSGLFNGQGFVDLELLFEMDSWINCSSTDHIYLLDALLKISVCWQADLATSCHNFLQEKKGNYLDKASFPFLPASVPISPLSPLLYCALCLAYGRFRIFSNDLPKFIQSYIDALYTTNDSSSLEINKTPDQVKAFFVKYDGGFRSTVQLVLQRVVLRTVYGARAPERYKFIFNLVVSDFKPVFHNQFDFSKLLEQVCCDTIIAGSEDELNGGNIASKQKKKKDTKQIDLLDMLGDFSEVSKAAQNLDLILRGLNSSQVSSEKVKRRLSSAWIPIAVHFIQINEKKRSNFSLCWSWLQDKWEVDFPLDFSSSVAGFVPLLLHLLMRLNFMLLNQIHEPGDLSNSEALRCFEVADFLSDRLFYILPSVQDVDLIMQLMGNPLMVNNIMTDTAFGMIVRKTFVSLVDSLHGKSISATNFSRSLQYLMNKIGLEFTEKEFNFPFQRDSTYEALLQRLSITPNSQFSNLLQSYYSQRIESDNQLSINVTEYVTTIESKDSFRLLSHPIFKCLKSLSLSASHKLLGSIEEITVNMGYSFESLKLLSSGTILSYLDSNAIVLLTEKDSKLVQRKPTIKLLMASERSLTSVLLLQAAQQEIAITEDKNSFVSVHLRDMYKTILKLSKRPEQKLMLERLCQAWEESDDNSLPCIAVALGIMKTFPSVFSLKALVDFISFVSDTLLEDSSSSSCVAVLNSFSEVLEMASRGIFGFSFPSEFEESERWKANFVSCLEKIISSLDVHSDMIILGITNLLQTVYLSMESNGLSKALYPAFDESACLSILVKGSNFLTILDNKSSSASVLVLRLLLVLVSKLVKLQNKDTIHLDEKNYKLLERVHTNLYARYSGSMSERDRLSLRILQVLNEVHVGKPLIKLDPKNYEKDLNNSSSSGGGSSNNSSFISHNLVLKTLSNFPLWRSLLPQAFDWEKCFDSSRCDTVRQKWLKHWTKQQQNSEEEYTKTSVDLCNRHGERGSGSSSSSSGSSTSSNEEDFYDPAFLIPKLYHSLIFNSSPVREIVHCGALSLIIMSLASDCDVMRIYALSCLDIIWERIEDAESPSALFREKVQVSLLLSYIRNAIDLTASPSNKALQVPSINAHFLARAAAILLQPKHELYSIVNMYIVRKPFCSLKDVPLFDTLVLHADSETQVSERISVLRLYRDSLKSLTDHSNFCKKNGYSYLMLLFPVVSQDLRAGQAILDIFDSALRQREVAEYLLHRTDFFSWILSVCTSAHANKNIRQADSNREAASSSRVDPFASRALLLIRRCIVYFSLSSAIGDGSPSLSSQTLSQTQPLSETQPLSHPLSLSQPLSLSLFPSPASVATSAAIANLNKVLFAVTSAALSLLQQSAGAQHDDDYFGSVSAVLWECVLCLQTVAAPSGNPVSTQAQTLLATLSYRFFVARYKADSSVTQDKVMLSIVLLLSWVDAPVALSGVVPVDGSTQILTWLMQTVARQVFNAPIDFSSDNVYQINPDISFEKGESVDEHLHPNNSSVNTMMRELFELREIHRRQQQQQQRGDDREAAASGAEQTSRIWREFAKSNFSHRDYQFFSSKLNLVISSTKVVSLLIKEAPITLQESLLSWLLALSDVSLLPLPLRSRHSIPTGEYGIPSGAPDLVSFTSEYDGLFLLSLYDALGYNRDHLGVANRVYSTMLYSATAVSAMLRSSLNLIASGRFAEVSLSSTVSDVEDSRTWEERVHNLRFELLSELLQFCDYFSGGTGDERGRGPGRERNYRTDLSRWLHRQRSTLHEMNLSPEGTANILMIELMHYFERFQLLCDRATSLARTYSSLLFLGFGRGGASVAAIPPAQTAEREEEAQFILDLLSSRLKLLVLSFQSEVICDDNRSNLSVADDYCERDSKRARVQNAMGLAASAVAASKRQHTWKMRMSMKRGFSRTKPRFDRKWKTIHQTTFFK